MLEVIVQRSDDIAIRHTGNGGVKDSIPLPYLAGMAQAHLTVERHEYVGGIRIGSGMQKVLTLSAFQHFCIVHVRIVGSTRGHAAQDVLGSIYVKRIEFLGDFRNLAPIGLV